MMLAIWQAYKPEKERGQAHLPSRDSKSRNEEELSANKGVAFSLCSFH
jgi:hypothetical protein